MMHYALLRPEETYYLLFFMSTVAAVGVLELRSLLALAWCRWRKNQDLRAVRRRRFDAVVHLLALAGLFCVGWGYFIEPTWLELTVIEHPFKGVTRRVRIMQISDTHCDLVARNESRAVELFHEMNPDIIVFTGDSVNDRMAFPNFRSMLNALPERAVKLGIRGNYDTGYWRDVDIFAGTDFAELNSRTVHPLNDQPGLTVSGIPMNQPGNLKKLAAKLNPADCNILLFHSPHLADTAATLPFDLYLSGHVHGGQVALPFWGAVITFSPTGKRFERGAYDLGRCLLYVNRGLGMEGGHAPRVRFWSRPELTVIDLIPEN